MDIKKTILETPAGWGGIMKTSPLKLLLSTFVGGLVMWIIAGLWHNLILPSFDSNAQAHHDGLGIMLVSYFILAFLMACIYALSYKGGSPVIEGLKIGIVIGVLWVFPHGLAMAGAHDTSVIYEVKNTLYHIIEQGIGGIIIAIIWGGKIR
jgi:hypothetical protein